MWYALVVYSRDVCARAKLSLVVAWSARGQHGCVSVQEVMGLRSSHAPMGHCGSTGFVRSVSLASVTKMFVMASTPKRSNSEGTSRCAKRSMSSFKSCSLTYLQKKVASVTCGRCGSILVARNALTRRAVAESHDSSGFVVIESSASRAACFASEFNPSSRTRRRSQSVAVTCRTCVGSHCPEMRHTTTGTPGYSTELEQRSQSHSQSQNPLNASKILRNVRAHVVQTHSLPMYLGPSTQGERTVANSAVLFQNHVSKILATTDDGVFVLPQDSPENPVWTRADALTSKRRELLTDLLADYLPTYCLMTESQPVAVYRISGQCEPTQVRHVTATDWLRLLVRFRV